VLVAGKLRDNVVLQGDYEQHFAIMAIVVDNNNDVPASTGNSTHSAAHQLLLHYVNGYFLNEMEFDLYEENKVCMQF
jgi:hypothetical protein